MRGMIRFRRKSKLSPLHIGPFEIIHVVGEVAYELALPQDFAVVRPVFHVSMLWIYIPDSSHVFRWDSVLLDDHLTFVDEPILVLVSDVRRLPTR